MASFDLHVINPKRGKKSTKKVAKKKSATRRRTAKKTPAKKGATTVAKKRTSKKAPARRRRATTTTAVARRRPPARRRRRRTSNPAPVKRRTTRRRRRTTNPIGLLGITSQIKKFLPRLAGKLAVAYAVKRFAGGSSWGGGLSELAGGAWSWKQYFTAAIVAMYGGKFLGRFVGGGAEFTEGAWDLILTKAIWTEGIARSPWMVEQLGADGDVQYNKASGQMMIEQGGRMVNMQGGTLVQAGPLDGFGGLEDGPMLGGTLVQAGPLDGPYYDSDGLAGASDGANPYSSNAVYG